MASFTESIDEQVCTVGTCTSYIHIYTYSLLCILSPICLRPLFRKKARCRFIYTCMYLEEYRLKSTHLYSPSLSQRTSCRRSGMQMRRREGGLRGRWKKNKKTQRLRQGVKGDLPDHPPPRHCRPHALCLWLFLDVCTTASLSFLTTTHSDLLRISPPNKRLLPRPFPLPIMHLHLTRRPPFMSC